MDLVRSWLGQALRATGAAVVVPVAILAALSLTAVGGSGLAGLGALTQIVSGPATAGTGTAVDGGQTEIGEAVTQLAAAGADAPAAAPVAPGGPAPGGGGGTGDGPGGGPGPVGEVPPPDPDRDGGGDPAPPAPPPGGGGGGTPPVPPAAPAPPGLVEGVGDGVKDVTDGTPLAPTVEDAVDTLIELCGRLRCP